MLFGSTKTQHGSNHSAPGNIPQPPAPGAIRGSAHESQRKPRSRRGPIRRPKSAAWGPVQTPLWSSVEPAVAPTPHTAWDGHATVDSSCLYRRRRRSDHACRRGGCRLLLHDNACRVSRHGGRGQSLRLPGSHRRGAGAVRFHRSSCGHRWVPRVHMRRRDIRHRCSCQLPGHASVDSQLHSQSTRWMSPTVSSQHPTVCVVLALERVTSKSPRQQPRKAPKAQAAPDRPCPQCHD
jgi:hypothetical protein